MEKTKVVPLVAPGSAARIYEAKHDPLRGETMAQVQKAFAKDRDFLGIVKRMEDSHREYLENLLDMALIENWSLDTLRKRIVEEAAYWLEKQ